MQDSPNSQRWRNQKTKSLGKIIHKGLKSEWNYEVLVCDESQWCPFWRGTNVGLELYLQCLTANLNGIEVLVCDETQWCHFGRVLCWI